jgi:hypothetical protein
MTAKYTLRDFTKIIVAAEKREDEEKIFNQLKGLAGRKLLCPIFDYYGPKGALLFAESEIYRARILLAAIDVGIASSDLAYLDAHINNETGLSLGPAIESLTDGNTDWLVELTRIRTPERGLETSVRWLRNDYGGEGRVDPSARNSFSLGGPIEAVLYIRFTGICKAIWDEFRKADR